jgi:hypothetical protein
MSSPDKRALALPFVRFVVVLALLVAPWPWVGFHFVDTVGSVTTTLADPMFAASNVTFALRSPMPKEQQPEWWGVIAVKRDSFPDGSKRNAGAIDLRRAGYLQLATFIALAAGWPPSGIWRCLMAGLLAALFVTAILAVPILDFLSSIEVVHLGGFAFVVALIRRALIAPPGMVYAGPGLVWLAVRGGSAAQWLARIASPTDRQSPAALSVLRRRDRHTKRAAGR